MKIIARCAVLLVVFAFVTVQILCPGVCTNVSASVTNYDSGYAIRSIKCDLDTGEIFSGDVLVAQSGTVILQGEFPVSSVRGLAEAVEAEAIYDHETKTITLEADGTVMVFTYDTDTYTINGETAYVSTPMCMINSRTYVPVYEVFEAFGYTLEEDIQENALIYTKKVRIKPASLEVEAENGGIMVSCNALIDNADSSSCLIWILYEGQKLVRITTTPSPSDIEYMEFEGNFDRLKVMLVGGFSQMKPLAQSHEFSWSRKERFLAQCNKGEGYRCIYEALRSDLYEYELKAIIQALSSNKIREISGNIYSISTYFQTIEDFEAACKKAYNVYLSSVSGGAVGGGGGSSNTVESAGTIRT